MCTTYFRIGILHIEELAKPVTDLINSAMMEGLWPEIFKMEIVTPVTKEYPPKIIHHLRNISGLLNLDNVSDMKTGISTPMSQAWHGILH